MVNIENFFKSFRDLEVLKQVNISISQGQTVALLGPNGSGKSTLLKSILGLVLPSQGTIQINGFNVYSTPDIRKHIAYLPQSVKFPENVTVHELISMMEDIRGQKADPQHLIQLFELHPFLNKRIKYLSGGTKQKINIVVALMFPDAQILILDEPTVGLDPLARTMLKDWLLLQKNNLKTLILCTHILSDIEELCDFIIFILDGKIHYFGKLKDLIQNHNEANLERAIANILTQQKQSHV